MSSNRNETHGGWGGLDGERIAELAIDRSAQPSERESELLAKDGELNEQLRDMRGFIDRQREVVANETETMEFTALADRILSATTRRRPSLAGDLRLVRDLVLLRCRQSVWVRLAAASLILHLAALPVVAWFVLHEPEKPQRIFFAPPVVVEAVPEPDDEIELDAPDMASLLEEDSSRQLNAFEIRNARRLERFSLHRWGAPASAHLPANGRIEKILAARSLGINVGDWSALDELENRSGSPLAEALYVEALLDRAVLDEEPSGLRAALERLRPVGAPELSSSTSLVRSAVLRATELGFDDGELRSLWRADSWATAGLASRQGHSAKPLSNSWFTQFEHATRSLARGAVLDAWLDWNPR